MKVLYITYEWNFTKTCSSVFFPELLKNYFDVELYMLKDDSDLDFTKINSPDYDAVIFFQCEPDFTKVQNKNAIFVPMYDTFGFTSKRIRTLKNIKLINFSKRLHKESLRYGINSFYIQYYPPVNYNVTQGTRSRVFFWNRQKSFDGETICNAVLPDNLGDYGIEYVNIHSTDSKNSHSATNGRVGESQTMHGTKLVHTSWFDKKEDLTDLLDQTRYYFAPRDKEGIGFSFLDALEHGCVIIAHNEGTMNEYIKNGINGYLINYKRPKTINFKDFDIIQQNSTDSMIKGRKIYEETIPQMIDFIKDPFIKKHSLKNAAGTFTVNFVRVADKVLRILKVR